ncbi:MAG: hypothetical protein V1686_01060 [Patescibacteria group bacterium]
MFKDLTEVLSKLNQLVKKIKEDAIVQVKFGPTIIFDLNEKYYVSVSIEFRGISDFSMNHLVEMAQFYKVTSTTDWAISIDGSVSISLSSVVTVRENYLRLYISRTKYMDFLKKHNKSDVVATYTDAELRM